MDDLHENHFPRVEGLVRRTKFDSPEQFGPRLAIEERHRAKRPRLVSTFEGRIQQLLLALPRYTTTDPLASLFRGILAKLRAGLAGDSSVIALAHRANASVVEAWLAEAGLGEENVVPVDDSVHFSVWAEDPYVSVLDEEAPDRVFLVEPPAFGRYADGLLADYVFEAGHEVRTYQVPLYLQGGNVLVGDDFFLIGLDYPLRTLEAMFQPSGSDPVGQVGDEYRRHLDVGRRPLMVGTGDPVRRRNPAPFVAPDGRPGIEIVGGSPGRFQPIFHIDMFVSLVGPDPEGRFQVMVGDPRRAAELLGEALPPHANAEAFDEIADRLVALGLRVLRNPLPYTYFDEWRQDEERWIRTWYFATSNNALVEVAGEARQVWLPTYGYGAWEQMRTTDAENRQAWTNLGFTVHELPDFHPLAQSAGAVHCLKKYLRRSIPIGR